MSVFVIVIVVGRSCDVSSKAVMEWQNIEMMLPADSG